MLAFCLTEVMDNNIRPLLFQEWDLFTFTLMLGCVVPALWMAKQITQPRTLQGCTEITIPECVNMGEILRFPACSW